MTNDDIPQEMQPNQSASGKSFNLLSSTFKKATFVLFIFVWMVIPFLPVAVWHYATINAGLMTGFTILIAIIWFDFHDED